MPTSRSHQPSHLMSLRESASTTEVADKVHFTIIIATSQLLKLPSDSLYQLLLIRGGPNEQTNSTTLSSLHQLTKSIHLVPTLRKYAVGLTMENTEVLKAFIFVLLNSIMSVRTRRNRLKKHEVTYLQYIPIVLFSVTSNG